MQNIKLIFQSRYKQDMSLAIQLLQCKPDSFIPQKITSVNISDEQTFVLYLYSAITELFIYFSFQLRCNQRWRPICVWIHIPIPIQKVVQVALDYRHPVHIMFFQQHQTVRHRSAHFPRLQWFTQCDALVSVSSSDGYTT